MNAAQIHLALNHAPLFLSIIGGIILILGNIKKNDQFKTLSHYFLAAASLLAIPVYFTGEGTEELVEHLPGVNEGAIERHEDMAKISMVIIAITGILALLSLLFKKKTVIVKILSAGALLFSLLSFGTMAQTAHLGGLIRHTELQNRDVLLEKTEDNEKQKEAKENSKKSEYIERQINDSTVHENREKENDDD